MDSTNLVIFHRKVLFVTYFSYFDINKKIFFYFYRLKWYFITQDKFFPVGNGKIR
jgi:hypothetical protein